MEPQTLFIYYKVDARHAQALEPAARQMQAALMRAHPGLVARLWVSGDASAPTWMESYEHPHGVDDALANLIEQTAQATLSLGRIGARHVEKFVNVG